MILKSIRTAFTTPFIVSARDRGFSHVPFQRERVLPYVLPRPPLLSKKPSASVVPDRFGMTKTGLFIDADNVSYRCAEKAISVAKDRGETNLCCIRAYKDWNKEPTDSNLVKTCDRIGIEQIQVNRAARKNSSDIKMCVDVMKIMYTTDIHRFILVTSDSDFRHVLLEIRGMGRVGCVYHSGPSKNRWLVGYADDYVMLDEQSVKKNSF